MKVRLKCSKDKKLTNRECKFGITDELTFVDLFGMNTTFIGFLSKIDNTDDEYKFTVDRIERDKTQTLTVLDANNKADRRYMKLALEHDYELTEKEYEILD